MLDQSLAGKNVLVTGAGRNVGRGIALEMAAANANVYFTEIDTGRCEALKAILGTYPIASRGIIADIADTKATDTMCDWLRREAIDIDILINNVGVTFDSRLEHSTIPERIANRIRFRSKAARSINSWRKIFDTNVFG